MRKIPCFALALGVLVAAGPAAAEWLYSKWSDADNVSYEVAAVIHEDVIKLGVVCKEGAAGVFVTPTALYAFGQTIAVEYGFGDDPARQSQWPWLKTLSAQISAADAATADEVAAFIAGLRTSDRITVKIRDRGPYEIDISGKKELIDKALKRCP